MTETPTAERSVSARAGDFLERWLAAFNSRQPERVLELMTDDITYQDSGRPEAMRGHGQVREFLELLWRAFPEFEVEAVGGPLVAPDGARAAFWWRSRMRNTGAIDPPGIPATGRVVEYEGADFHEYRNGKVARLRIVFDMADVSRQLGLLPAPGSRGERAIIGAQRLRMRVSRLWPMARSAGG